MAPEPQVTKLGMVLPIPDEILREHQAMAEALRRWQESTPEEREAVRRRLAEDRAQLRASTARTELTVDTLLAKLGWSREYAEHVVQPYCECEPEQYDGGWYLCAHAQDLGLEQF